MSTRRTRALKRESAVGGVGSLPTPDTSFATTSTTMSPKRRESFDVGRLREIESVQPQQPHHAQPNGDLPIRADSPNKRAIDDDDRTDTLSANGPPQANGDGLSVLGHDVNRLVNLIDKLRRIGLKSIDGALPELVLVGDQSAGKSSLMGAIAEINLPKKAAMCTRCPYNIKTSPAAEWECSVSLQEDHIYETGSKKGHVSRWQPRDGMVTRLFKTIHDKSELEEVLTWAQIALLNPHSDLDNFVPGNPGQMAKKEAGDESIEAQYSPNVVAVEIRGPGLPALSFYDLPGLFQEASNADLQFLVKAFDDLTVKYIKHESAIIICTITMANDAALSKTKRLIRHHKADHKCVGVLTMPDRMQGGALQHADYDGILRGTAFVLPRGYYVTKQPGPDCLLDRGAPDYHVLARQEEEQFFDNYNSPWSPDGEWSRFRGRCGTSTIQKYLSKEFARQILGSLPDLTAKINDQTRQVEQELAKLPEISNDKVQHIVRKQLFEFSSQVREIVNGSSSTCTFHSDWTKLCGQFLKAIESMRPGCHLKHHSDKVRQVNPATHSHIRDVISLDDSDNESTVSTIRRQPNGTPSTANRELKRPRVDDTPIPFATPKRIKQENGYFSVSSPQSKDDLGVFQKPYLDNGKKAMSISAIRMAIQKYSKAGRPGFVSPKVHEDFALQAIHFWSEPLDDFLQQTFQMLRAEVTSTLRTTFQLHTDLYTQSVAYIEEFLLQHEEEQRRASHEFFEMESRSLFTINTEAFNRHKAEAHDMLRKTRREIRLNAYVDSNFRPRTNNLAEPNDRSQRERDNFKKNITDETLGPDPFDKEIDVAAYIRGYYTTARFRFTDSVCANIYSRFFHNIASKISYYLEERFKIDEGDSEAKCQALLEGSPEVAQRRTLLKHRKQQLLEFSKTLNELKNDTFAEEEVPRLMRDDDDVFSVMSIDPDY